MLAGCAGVLAALAVVTGPGQAAAPSATSTATTTTPTTSTTTPKAAPKPKPRAATRTITCKANLVATKPLDTSAENFGTVTCSTPLGKGVSHDTSTVATTSPTAGTFSGGVKLFLNTGTLRGTFKMSYTVANKALTFDGTIKISSGTGEFSGVTGNGAITGTSADGVHSAITEKMTLTFPPKKTTA